MKLYKKEEHNIKGISINYVDLRCTGEGGGKKLKKMWKICKTNAHLLVGHKMRNLKRQTHQSPCTFLTFSFDRF